MEKQKPASGGARTIKCTSLDYVEVVHQKMFHPLIFCHLDIVGTVDLERLKKALRLSASIVPEILYGYDYQKVQFIDRGFTENDIVYKCDDVSETDWRLNIGEGPQLKIKVSQVEQRCKMVMVMSHVVTDGAGFKQFLDLLTSFYSGKRVSNALLKNNRMIPPFVRSIKVEGATAEELKAKKEEARPFSFSEPAVRPYCLTCLIGPGDVGSIKNKARQSGVTLNDAFMAAYARVAARETGSSRIKLPCPADLRSFGPMPEGLSITNLSGMYEVPIAIGPSDSFEETLDQVHEEMLSLKRRNRCFSHLATLEFLYGKIPRPILDRIVLKTSAKLPISYTNLGIIDESCVAFDDCIAEHCFMTGAYRYPPDFQLSISTFKDTCTLNCTLLGDESRKEKAQGILEAVKAELLDWTYGKNESKK